MSKTESGSGGRMLSIRKFFGSLGVQLSEKEPQPPLTKPAMTQDEAVNQVNDLSKWLRNWGKFPGNGGSQSLESVIQASNDSAAA